MEDEHINTVGQHDADTPDSADQAAVLVVNPNEHYASHLRESTASLFMFASMGQSLKNVETGAYRMFRDRLLVDCGSPTDPIEVMLIEQMALAHLNVGQLHYKAAAANSIECAGVYLAAGARLMAEFRRSALALKEYRCPQGKCEKSTETVEPGEPAAERESAGDPREKCTDIKVGTSEGGHEHEDSTIQFRRPTTIRVSTAEPPAVAGVHGRGARAASRTRHGKSAVAACNGAENRGGQGALCS
jgi:hypothetical protein